MKMLFFLQSTDNIAPFRGGSGQCRQFGECGCDRDDLSKNQTGTVRSKENNTGYRSRGWIHSQSKCGSEFVLTIVLQLERYPMLNV